MAERATADDCETTFAPILLTFWTYYIYECPHKDRSTRMGVCPLPFSPTSSWCPAFVLWVFLNLFRLDLVIWASAWLDWPSVKDQCHSSLQNPNQLQGNLIGILTHHSLTHLISCAPSSWKSRSCSAEAWWITVFHCTFMDLTDNTTPQPMRLLTWIVLGMSLLRPVPIESDSVFRRPAGTAVEQRFVCAVSIQRLCTQRMEHKEKLTQEVRLSEDNKKPQQ